MKVQILVSTVNQQDNSLIQKMNIFADTIVINQCDRVDFRKYTYNGHQVEWYDCIERGVGISRNKALMAATADICIFADDDMVYSKESLKNVNRVFLDAGIDVVAFNISGSGKEILKRRRLHSWNAYKYGAARIAVRRESILEKRISFSLLFGGGARYSCGEDTLFLKDCLKNGLKVYEVTEYLGTNTGGDSTWFSGYNRKFFVDKGVLYAAMNKWIAPLYCIRYVILRAKIFDKEVSHRQALMWMFDGINQYK